MAEPSLFDVTDDLDRMLALPTPKPIDISQNMILDIATGWEEPEAIAARYGYEGIAWERLKAYKPFLQAVEAQRAELERDGSIFRSQAKALGADVYMDLYRMAKSGETTFGQKQGFVELSAKLGDMIPKAAQAQTAPAGSVTIMFTTGGRADPMTIDAIDVTTKQVT